ncbi:hypothetical protein VE03_09422 [Pseudogymnoascus sp. 23342-1-I1]|nr:hypothetical protein VE03_09422 [Pseudogymnoascus sp. 23342-1-I1]
MAQITLRQRKTALSKATKDLEREKADFLPEKADVQRMMNELQRELEAANDKAVLKVTSKARQRREAELERQREEMWEWMTIIAAVFLFIPALSLSASLLAAETVGGWRMFLWAIAAAAGNGGGR